jgi:hypothetical protein
MSWDVSIYKLSEHTLYSNGTVNDQDRIPLGTVAQVRDLITKRLPEMVWESYYTGYCLGEDYRFDFFVGDYDSEDDAIIDHLDVCVHGLFSDAASDTLLRLTVPYGWTIQEMMEGRLILPETSNKKSNQ